jgi:hypothetical protein
VAAPSLAGCTLRRVAAPPSPYCRSGDPLAGVYHPQRLDVKSRCRVATGTVTRVEFEAYDGDVHIDLALDDADLDLLSSGNDRVGYELVVEIIPQDRSVVAVPEVGMRITVVGPWVEDTTHGWSEIHPAWWVSSGRIIPATPQELARVRELLAGGTEAEGD